MDQELTFEMNLDGQQVTCTILFTFSSEETQANYLIYTPDAPDGTQVRVMAARFDPENLTALYPLEGDADRVIVQSFLDYMQNQQAEEPEEEADDGIRTIDDLPS